MKNKVFKFISLILFLFCLSGFRTNIAFNKAQQSKLVITTAAQNVFIGNCSGGVTVQSQSPSGAPQSPASNLVVNLSSTGSMQFFSDSMCTSTISTVTIIPGSSSKSFYFMLTAVGSETISAAASGYVSASQLETATTNPFVWTGGGGNANWNNGANWSGGISPSTTSHFAIFDSTCASNCSPTINVSLSIGGVRINSGYAGTITLAAGNSLTIDTKGWVQAAGSFVGGNSSITLNGGSKVSSGNFTSTSGTLTINKDFIFTGGSYTHNSGKVIFSGTGYPTTYSLNSLIFNNVDFVENAWGNIDFAGTTFTINGNLKLEAMTGCNAYCTLDNGTVNVKGNVNIVNDGYFGAALIKLTGASNQTIDGSLSNASGRLPSLEIASTGGTVSFVGTIGVNKNYTFTSGTVNTGTSTLNLIGTDQNIIPGVVSYYNVTMSNVNWQQKTLLGGTMTVANDLLLSTMSGCGGWCKLDNGTINVGRNITITNGGFQGTAVLNMTGSANANYTISGTTSIPSGSVTINKSSSSATVTLASNMPLTNTSQALTITSGILNLSGYTLTVNSVLTIGPAGSLLCSSGTYTSGSLVNNGTIDCAGYPFNWTGAGANANWNTAANWAGGVAPNSTQVAIFKDSYCGSNCNATITADPNVRGVRLLSAYSGTITQNTGVAITIGSSGWNQAGGIFSGSNASFTTGYNFVLTGGTFTSTSSTLTVQNDFTQSGASVFNSNSGTIKTTGTSTITATGTLNHLYIDSSYTTVTINGSVNVAGNFTYGTSTCCGMTLNAGTAPGEINVQGNATNNLPSGYGGGSAKVRIVGSGAQTVNAVNGGAFPNLELASSGTINLAGSIVTNNFIHSSGTVNAGTSTVALIGGGSITTNGMNFYNLNIGPYNPVVNGTITVDNDIVIGNASGAIYLNQGTAPGVVQVKRHVTVNSYDGYGGGNASLKLIGSGAQTITGTSGFLPSLEIANTGGVVTLSGTIKIGKNFTYTSASSVVSTGANLRFVPGDYATASISAGSIVYNNIYFDSASVYTLSGTVFAGGNVTLNSNASGSGSINSGTIDVQGNLVFTNYGLSGNGNINFSGSGNSSITIGASAVKPTGGITINKSSSANLVSLTANTSFPGASQDLTITSGTLDMAGYNLTVGRNVTNSDTLKRGNNPTCGTLSYGGSFSGNAAVCP